MARSVYFGLFLLVVRTSAQTTGWTPPQGVVCPQSSEFDPPDVRPISFCNSYVNRSVCCNSTMTASMAANFASRLAPIYGNSNCYENLKSLFCTWLCDDRQARWTEWSYINQTQRIFNFTISVSPALGQQIFDSCKRRCIVIGQAVPVTFMFPTAASFINQFRSDALGGQPSVEIPLTVMVLGSGPAGPSSWIDDAYFTPLPLSAADTQTDGVRCGAAPSTTIRNEASGGSAVMPSAGLLTVLVAVALLLLRS
eukprot:TRINITY_DN8566_c0_g1_i1.p1 TRINITY_DN8566_c0_g1~~TRINITY_DN8566_c0_g1_i1.p1  ORF type:complete len:253 (-),score=28.12 TRINITY_DN8566_c0_g1_i1:156-914(-)